MAAKVHVQQAHNGEAVIEAGAGPGQTEEKVEVKISSNGPPTEPVSLKISPQEQSGEKDKWIPKWKRPTPKPLYESTHELPTDVMETMLNTWDTVGIKRLGQTFVHSSMVIKVAAAADNVEGLYNGRTSSSRIPTIVSSATTPGFPFTTQPGFSPITSVGQPTSSATSPYGQLPLFGQTPVLVKTTTNTTTTTRTPPISSYAEAAMTSTSSSIPMQPLAPSKILSPSFSPFAASVANECITTSPTFSNNNYNNNNNNNNILQSTSNSINHSERDAAAPMAGVIASPFADTAVSPFTSISNSSASLSSVKGDTATPHTITSPFAGVPSFQEAVVSPFTDVIVNSSSVNTSKESFQMLSKVLNDTNGAVSMKDKAFSNSNSSSSSSSAAMAAPLGSLGSETTTSTITADMFPEGMPPSPFLDPNSPATAVAMPSSSFTLNGSAMTFGAYNNNINKSSNMNEADINQVNLSMNATMEVPFASSMFTNDNSSMRGQQPPKYECEQCGKTFTTHDGMRMHSKAKHNIEVPPEKKNRTITGRTREEEVLDLPTYIPSPVDLSLTTPFGKKETTEVWADVEVSPYTHMMSNATLMGTISEFEIIDDNSMNIIVYIADDDYDASMYVKNNYGVDASVSYNADTIHDRHITDAASGEDRQKGQSKPLVNPVKSTHTQRGEQITVHCIGFYRELAEQTLRRNDTVFVNGSLRLLRFLHMNRYYTIPIILVAQPFGLVAKVR